MTSKERNELRQAFAAYLKSEGCDCCRDAGAHDIAAAQIAKLLKVPKYKDGSGFNFRKFAKK